MSYYGPHNPDGRTFASYPMPAKIDLINERPRRESLVEQQLEDKIGGFPLPTVQMIGHSSPKPSQVNSNNNEQQSSYGNQNYREHQVVTNIVHHQPISLNQHPHQQMVSDRYRSNQDQDQAQTYTAMTATSSTMRSNKAALLSAELADKRAKLMVEIDALSQRPYSPFQVPAKIDLINDQQSSQYQLRNAPSPRPFSRASSTKSTAADLLDKDAKLMQDIEEMERKPYNPQTMVIEREQWFEYPEGRPNDRHLTDSKKRIIDFCSLPSHMYPEQGTHIHEENLPPSTIGRPPSAASSIHKTIIKTPVREIDNRSPLPFSFDNFSTKGVRGNIASVGAIEPERPRPPIYPMIKRTPSPNLK